MKNYRQNVGICLINNHGLIFAGRRLSCAKSYQSNEQRWQMPQGGVSTLDNINTLTLEMFRELYEEIGLQPHHVTILHISNKCRYDFTPETLPFLTLDFKNFTGQEQRYFYLYFLGKDADINLNSYHAPEFSEWKWASSNFLIENIIAMKKNVYKHILNQQTIHQVMDNIKNLNQIQ